VSITTPAAGSTVSGPSVGITASVTDATTVYFHVDGTLVGTRTSGTPTGAWSAGLAWDSTTVSNGPHTITATAVAASMATVSDSIQVTVANGPPPLSLTGIQPAAMPAGASVAVTVTGSGFQPGVTLTFANGSGATPTATNLVVLDAGILSASVSVKKRGPKGARVWDVVVTHPDGRTATFAGGFTVFR
jgi:hypothetical protein